MPVDDRISAWSGYGQSTSPNRLPVQGDSYFIIGQPNSVDAHTVLSIICQLIIMLYDLVAIANSLSGYADTKCICFATSLDGRHTACKMALPHGCGI